MRVMGKQEHIMDYLSRKLECNFLSDLGAPVYHLKEKKYFEWAPMYDYPLEDWKYVYRYILGVDSTATTIQELRDEFLKNL